MAVYEAGHAAARAIDDLYRGHAREVYRYALAVLGQPADAEDVTQTTFLNAYRSLESGVRPRKPANWLLTIASNVIKQRFRTEQARPRQALLGDPAAEEHSEDTTPTIGELMAALGQIPPLQRQAIVLREFEGRSYREIAEILGVTTSALETLLFRARRALAEEIENQLTCTEAQLAVSRAADGRLGRKERRRLRGHLEECPDCVRFVRLQQRNRRALRGLALVPVPVLDWPFRAVEAPAAASSVAAAAAGVAASGTGAGVLGGGVALKAAAVVTAASVAGGVGAAGGAEAEQRQVRTPPVRAEAVEQPGKRVGQVAPRGVAVPGRGLALGRTAATPAPKKPGAVARGHEAKPKRASAAPSRLERAESLDPRSLPATGRSAEAKAKPKPRDTTAGGLPPAKPGNARAFDRPRETRKPGAPVQSRRGGGRGR